MPQDSLAENSVNQLQWYQDGELLQEFSLVSQTEEQILEHILRQNAAEGFFATSVDSSIISEDQKKIFISSGCRFQIQNLSISTNGFDIGNRPFFLTEGSFYSDSILQQELEDILQNAEQQGFPLAKIAIDSFTFDWENCQVSVDVNLDIGEQIYAQEIRFSGLDRTSAEYLQRASGFRDSVLITPVNLTRIRRNIDNTNFYRHVSEAEIIRSGGRHELLFRLEENNINRFDAILGYVPEPGGSNTIVGNADLHIRNVAYQGSTLAIKFDRKQALTTSFAIAYELDWINSWPLGLSGEFDFVQQDTSYQIRNARLTSSYFINPNTRLITGVRREGITANQDPNLPALALDGQAVFGGVGIRFDNTNRRISPTSGFRINTFIETGYKNITDARFEEFGARREMNQQEINFDARMFVSPFRRQVLAFRGSAYLMISPEYTESDLTRFGGARSFRGYREDQFRASRLVWGDMEYRYLLDPTSYAFVFAAGGRYQRPQLITEITTDNTITRNLYSYGFGFSYNTPIGFVQFTYALSDEDVLSNGKIHFGIISEF